jgi:hypothetical protein
MLGQGHPLAAVSASAPRLPRLTARARPRLRSEVRRASLSGSSTRTGRRLIRPLITRRYRRDTLTTLGRLETCRCHEGVASICRQASQCPPVESGVEPRRADADPDALGSNADSGALAQQAFFQDPGVTRLRPNGEPAVPACGNENEAGDCGRTGACRHGRRVRDPLLRTRDLRRGCRSRTRLRTSAVVPRDERHQDDGCSAADQSRGPADRGSATRVAAPEAVGAGACAPRAASGH